MNLDVGWLLDLLVVGLYLIFTGKRSQALQLNHLTILNSLRGLTVCVLSSATGVQVQQETEKCGSLLPGKQTTPGLGCGLQLAVHNYVLCNFFGIPHNGVPD